MSAEEGLVLREWAVANLAADAPVVEAVDVFERGDSTSSAVNHGRYGLMCSVVNNPIVDSATGLSIGSPTEPIDSSAPITASHSV